MVQPDSPSGSKSINIEVADFRFDFGTDQRIVISHMISFQKDGVIRLDGRLDIDEAAAVRDALIESFSRHQDVTLNLAGVTDCDTAGAQLLLAAHAHAHSHSLKLRIVSASPAVRDTVSLLGFSLQME